MCLYAKTVNYCNPLPKLACRQCFFQHWDQMHKMQSDITEETEKEHGLANAHTHTSTYSYTSCSTPDFLEKLSPGCWKWRLQREKSKTQAAWCVCVCVEKRMMSSCDWWVSTWAHYKTSSDCDWREAICRVAASANQMGGQDRLSAWKMWVHVTCTWVTQVARDARETTVSPVNHAKPCFEYFHTLMFTQQCCMSVLNLGISKRKQRQPSQTPPSAVGER